MGHEQRHFFVLGLPRSRTAWASIALTVGRSYCFHDGLHGCRDFSEYLNRLTSRPEEVIGDSSPALAPHAQALVECFPDAPWLILERDPNEARAALERAAPGATSVLADGWGGIVDDFNAARAFLGDRAIAMPASDLDDWGKYIVAAQWLGADLLNVSRHEALCRLRITQILDHTPPPAEPAWWAVERFKEAGFSPDGLEARYVTDADLPTLDAWWRRRHPSMGIGSVPRPPLGVVVSINGEAAGAVWCYESFGVGLAQISFPVTRPGLLLPDAQRVIAYGIATVIGLAGQRCDPPARYTTFTASPSRGMARTLARLGFKEDPTERVAMTLHSDA
jgi:hypothetical protein